MSKLIEVLNNGGIAVMKTDTIYGIVTQASNTESINRIYAMKKRDPAKACIVMIPDIESLSDFGIETDDYLSHLNTYWPGPVSIILPLLESQRDKLKNLHRGNDSIAFRLPNDDVLREILRQTGPLVAPSANPEGQDPAMNIDQAKKYFGDQVDYYEDDGICEKTQSSKIIRFSDSGEITVLRA